jgi:acyl CoA:acetate/3-ketoacid CoA transferase
VRRYLEEGRGRDLNVVFDSTQRHQQEQVVEPLSEEEAIKVAVEGQHSWHREREAGDGR